MTTETTQQHRYQTAADELRSRLRVAVESGAAQDPYAVQVISKAKPAWVNIYVMFTPPLVNAAIEALESGIGAETDTLDRLADAVAFVGSIGLVS